jgi:hypothetical protein
MTKMKFIDVTQLSSDTFLALMPILFKRRGYELEGCVLWLKSKQVQHLAYCWPTLTTLSIDDLGRCIPDGVQSEVAFLYVMTQGRFSPEAVSSVVPWETELVDGAELQKWLRSAALF